MTPAELQQRLSLAGLEGEIYRGIAGLIDEPKNQETIRGNTPRHWRRCGGYNLDRLLPANGLNFKWPYDPRFNLAKLITGAEGTLAVITELKLNLVPRPAQTALAIIHFDDLFTALSAVPAMLEVEPTAVELLDNLGLTMCRQVPEYARLLDTFVRGEPDCVLITEFYGESDAELKAKVARLEEHMHSHHTGATHITPAYSPALQTNIWTVRKVGLGLLMSIKGDFKPIPFIEDAAVPPEHLAEYVTRVEEFCSNLGTKVAYYAHASAGCVHIRPLINCKAAAEVAKMPDIVRFSVELLRGYGGSFSSEHGDGRARSWQNEAFFGPDLFALYRQTKRLFDPHNLLNPGNIVDFTKMTENLRFGETYNALQIKSHTDFSADQGFDRAVEMCNGAGVCRKRTTGTMCPSFMVTLEEEHSTRGRANALRNALAGRLPVQEFTSRRMFEVMDLCIECKACKAECPSSVDMAKIKFEWLAQYYQENGTPLRPRIFGHIATFNQLGSGTLAPFANWAAGNGPLRGVAKNMLGITKKRKLPPFARQPFTTWFKQRPAPGNSRNMGQLILFHDPFTNYNYPEIAIAATELFEAAGFEVVLPGHKSDGRPFISKGLVKQARAAALDTIEHLQPYADQGLPIVGLEPSSLLSLRDEYFHLLPDDPRVKTIAENAFTFEEFVANLAGDGRLNLHFTAEPRHLLLHGHCHQKSLVGTGPSKKVLSLPANYTVEEVDSGCCGMAGSFGYEAEHYEISMQMAERRLLPAVRAAGTETLIVAAGVSCRQQIKHGSGRTSLHPAEVLRAALV